MAIETIRVTAGDNFPIWTFAHYVGATETNYRKLFLISRVCELLAGGATDSQFFVSDQSAQLYSSADPDPNDTGELVILAEKGQDADAFWHHIRRLHRPIVFFRDGDTKKSLYQIDGPEALKLITASVKSPPTLIIQGLSEIFRELFRWWTQDGRAQEKHDIEVRILKSDLKRRHIQELSDLASLAEKIGASTISKSYKDKILKLASDIVLNQEAQNTQLGAIIDSASAETIFVEDSAATQFFSASNQRTIGQTSEDK